MLSLAERKFLQLPILPHTTHQTKVQVYFISSFIVVINFPVLMLNLQFLAS
jgi:hypothetical protein